MGLRARPLRVHIARLVMQGVPANERGAFAAALRAEIARQLDGSRSGQSGSELTGVRQTAAATVRAVREAVDRGDGHG